MTKWTNSSKKKSVNFFNYIFLISEWIVVVICVLFLCLSDAVRMLWHVKYSSHLFVASLSVSLLFLLWFVFVAPSQCPPPQDAGLLRNTRAVSSEGQNRGADAGWLWTLHPSLIQKHVIDSRMHVSVCVCCQEHACAILQTKYMHISVCVDIYSIYTNTLSLL